MYSAQDASGRVSGCCSLVEYRQARASVELFIIFANSIQVMEEVSEVSLPCVRASISSCSYARSILLSQRLLETKHQVRNAMRENVSRGKADSSHSPPHEICAACPCYRRLQVEPVGAFWAKVR